MQSHPAIQEVIDLHTFFEGWLGGVLPADEGTFARFTAATDPSFTLIGPDGSMMESEAIADWIWQAHGTRPGFRLWTTDHRLHFAGAGCALVTYREWQTRDGVTTCRFSTAFFVPAETAPLRLCWRHVHETWLTPG